MPQRWRERVDMASAIKSILDGYPFGNGLLRELLQNSDDAGSKAHTFILDCRQHATDSLIDPALTATQGPALLSINDTVFLEKDWNALRTLHGSSKTADETQIGKYGLGFRSCYHVTDNPHILSGDTLVIFDPHNELSEPNTGGARINIIEEGREFHDQLQAFESVVSSVERTYQGTVVRLPLRTPEQASRSKIKSTAMRPSDIQDLFKEFAQREMDVALLFLKNVASIELREISASGQESFIGKVEIEDAQRTAAQRVFSPFNAGTMEKTFKFRIIATGPKLIRASRTWRIFHRICDSQETSTIMTRRLGYAVGDLLFKDKLFAHVALAIPLDNTMDQLDGRLFTLLPLPIYTGFPVHVHAILALTPDRQSLRNNQETGLSHASRERLLVEWNYLTFDTFLPAAWAKLLSVIVAQDSYKEIWAAWPPVLPHSPKPLYWRDLPKQLMSQVTENGYSVWPTFQCRTAGAHVALESALIADPDDKVSVLTSLANAGLCIVQPPHHIFELCNSFAEILSPETAHNALLNKQVFHLLNTLSSQNRRVILDYLIGTDCKTLTYTLGLPLFPLADKSYTALELRQPSSTIHILVNDNEVELFQSCDQAILPLSSTSPAMRTLLCSQRSVTTLNVALLNEHHVMGYLNCLFGHFDPALDEKFGPEAKEHLHWLIRFWRTSLRQTGSSIITTTGPPANILPVLQKYDVPFLHKDVTKADILMRSDIVARADNVPIILDLISPTKPCADRNRGLLQKYFVTCLQGNPSTKLNDTQVETFRMLPIFPTLKPVEDGKDATSVPDTAKGNLVYVDMSGSGCLPIIPGTTFMDMSKSTRILATLIEPAKARKPLKEEQLLAMAIPHLHTQPPVLLDKLVERIVARMSDLTKQSRENLRRTPFVRVKGLASRIPPRDVVDPDSLLADLYTPKDGVLPDPPFHEGPALDVFRTHGMFRQTLTYDVLLDKINMLSRTSFTPVTWPALRKKAEILLEVLDKTLLQRNILQSPLPRDVAWLPGQEKLCTTGQCRDDHNPYLFDLVLSVVKIRLKSPKLRAALGFTDRLPFEVLRLQLKALLGIPSRADSVFRVITYMSTSWKEGGVSMQEMQDLIDDVGNKPWIPVSESPALLVSTRHAVFLDADVGGSFRKIPPKLCREARPFLEKMGCTERPSFDSLLEELQVIPTDTALEQVPRVLRILEMIVEHVQSGDDNEAYRDRILVPDDSGHLRRISEVFYDDISRDDLSDMSHYGSPTHGRLSKVLASNLAIRCLSELELGDGEDEDDIEMAEDIAVRIKGVLKDYSIDFSSNEFIANADDARATQVHILLDEESFQSKNVMSSNMEGFQLGPALILHNDALFSKEDFIGMRRIGQGSKQEASDTIGRFGLGALSLFHFTDVPMVISGPFVMFLDPSGEHLPKFRGKKRTVLFRKLSLLRSKFPDHLVPLDGVFEFSALADEYQGTIFRLPLRTPEQAAKTTALSSPIPRHECLTLLEGPYFELAQNSLFFTGFGCSRLGSISAERRCFRSEKIEPLWTVSVDRIEPSSRSLSAFSARTLTLKTTRSRRGDRRFEWLIASAITSRINLPLEHDAVLRRHNLKIRLERNGMDTRIAIQLPSMSTTGRDVAIQKYHLFSTLRLPVITSLPFHLHGRFVLSSNRRNIIFEPPDARGIRNPESSHNIWILSSVVPDLYNFALEWMGESRRTNWDWWPRAANDIVSRHVVNSFYDLFPTTKRSICQTASMHFSRPDRVVFSFQEPPLVTRFLNTFQAANFVDLPSHFRSLVKKHDMQRVTPSFLKEFIHGCQDNTFQNHRIKVDELDAVLCFMLEGNVSPLGLPILLLENDTLIGIPAVSPLIPPIYYWEGDVSVFRLFSSSLFLSRKIAVKTAELLLRDASLNVKKLDAPAVVNLVRERVGSGSSRLQSSETSAWIQDFWALYDALLRRLRLSIDSLPLLPTYRDGMHVSSDHVLNGCALPPPSVSDLPLLSILTTMDILVCKPFHPASNLSSEHFNMGTFLKCLSLSQRTPASMFSLLDTQDHTALAQWIRDRIENAFSDRFDPVIGRLPIWPVWKDGHPLGLGHLASADTLEMLPAGTTVARICRYISPNLPVAEYSGALRRVLTNCSLISRVMSNSALFGSLRLPPILPRIEMGDFLYLLELVLNDSDHRQQALLVPDGNLSMVPPSRLYDDAVPIFAAAFATTLLTSFIHSDLRPYQARLHSLGLQHTVNFSTFEACARAVNDDLEIHNISENDVVARAHVVARSYSMDLPSHIMSNSSQWRRIDSLRFVPRLANRQSHSLLHEWSSFCKPLPLIVSPQDLVRMEFEPMTWTQRGLFVEQPSQDLLIHPTIGIPTASEVVAHLFVLSQDIATQHSGNSRLLADLDKTYGWLNEHAEDARPALIKHLDVPLFLNVDNPEDEHWQWRSAERMVVNLEWDENGLAGVRRFLYRFTPLLLAAGAHNLALGKFHQSNDARPNDFTQIRAVFEEMRQADEFTDVIFVPAFDESTSYDGLKAHKCFLAAAIPHMRHSLRSDFKESKTASSEQPLQYDFDGSSFGARAVLDFIYKGDLCPTAPKDDEAMDLLRELLELLDITEAWDMPELKDKVAWLIADKFKLVTPDSYKMVLTRASLYNVSSLIKFCEDWEQVNQGFLATRRN